MAIIPDIIYMGDVDPYQGHFHSEKVRELVDTRLHEYLTDCASSDMKPSLLGFAVFAIHDQGIRDGVEKAKLIIN